MTLTFDPQQPYVEMIMGQNINEFLDILGEEDNVYISEEDEGFLYDDEG
jgi:hypothetical protein